MAKEEPQVGVTREMTDILSIPQPILDLIHDLFPIDNQR